MSEPRPGEASETYLEFRDTKSHKFWTIVVRGNQYTVRYGKVGTQGQSKTKSFDGEAEAQQAADKLVRAKLKKGYEEAQPEAESEAGQPDRSVEKLDSVRWVAEVGGVGSSLPLWLLDGAAVRRWDGQDHDGVQDLQAERLAAFASLACPTTDVFLSGDGVAFLEFFPHDDLTAAQQTELAKRAVALEATDTEALAMLEVSSGCLALIPEWGVGTDISKRAVTGAAKAGTAQAHGDARLLPLPNGLYELHCDTFGDSGFRDDLGLYETRFRLVRKGPVPEKSGPPAKKPKARKITLEELDASKGTAESLGLFHFIGRAMLVLMDRETAHGWTQEQYHRHVFEASEIDRCVDVPGEGAKGVSVDLGAADWTVIWKTALGITFLEWHPKKGLEPHADETLAVVGQYAAQADAEPISRSDLALNSGCLVAMVSHGEVPKKAWKAWSEDNVYVVKADSGFNTAALIPIQPGHYDVFLDRLGGERAANTLVGKMDRRLRLCRRGD